MAKKPRQSSRLQLKPTGQIYCKNEQNLLIQISQLERYVEDIHERIIESTTPKWINVLFTATLSIFTFCLSPLLTCNSDQLQLPIPLQIDSKTLYICLIMLTIISSIIAFVCAICILVIYLKHKAQSGRDEIRDWAINHALERFSDTPELIGDTTAYIPFNQEDA